MPANDRYIIAITGAQGVGKSTFCRNLKQRLIDESRREVTLQDGLGARVGAMGIPLGSASTSDTITAIFAAHLEREAEVTDGIVLLDRCVVDALAYTRILGVSSEPERRLFEQITAMAAKRLFFVVHLKLSAFFKDKGADHETRKLREGVAREIPKIIRQLHLPFIDIDGANINAIETAASCIVERWHG